ncbi:MAG: DUF3987 domain-containing protein, partial [Gammaproteobacteria bacterium]|nr:DUF3987 domain-containing protein [Gammaproteobacteria bacterium]
GSIHPETSASCGPVATSSGSSSLLLRRAQNRTTRVLPNPDNSCAYDIARGFVEALRVPLDYIWGALIAAFIAAIGNRARLEWYPGAREPATLFVALVGASGTAKSPAFRVAERALMDIEDEMRVAHEAACGGRRHVGDIDEKIRITVANRLRLEGVIPIQRDEEGVPMPPSLRLTSWTGPGLLNELKFGIDGRALIADELIGPMARAASDHNLDSRALLLEGYNGRPRTDVTKTHGRIEIPCLWVSIFGTIQPDRIREMLGRARDGLSARFVWAYPDAKPTAELPLSSGPTDALKQVLRRLVSIQPQGDRRDYSTTIALADDARAPLEAARTEWFRLAEQTDGDFQDCVNRATDYTLRLAFVLALAEHATSGKDGTPTCVSRDEIERTIALVNGYVLRMAERTFAASGAPKLSDAALLARFLRRLGKPSFNVRTDLVRGAGSPVRTTERIALSLEELKQRGLILPATRSTTPGRPAQDWKLNPTLLNC